MRQLITVALVVVAVGTPAVIIVKSVLDSRRAGGSCGGVVLRALGALAGWLAVSLGMMFMLFVTFFASAHSDYRMSHDGAPDPSGGDDPTGTIALLVAVYALAGCGLSYWVLRRANR